MGDPQSLVHWFPKKDEQRCGYCNSPSGSIMFGMWAYRLRVEDYQDLIDRGWRRSGQYCYKSVMHETCCPLYTIRCNALEFRPTKSQKKVMKKMSKFLKTGIFKERERRELTDFDEGCEERIAVKECPNQLVNIDEIALQSGMKEASVVSSDNKKTEILDNTNSIPGTPETNLKVVQPDNVSTLKQRAVKKGLGPDPNRPPCKKAKILRYEKKMKKCESLDQSIETQTQKSECKSLEEFLNDVSSDDKHKLTLKLIEPTNPSSDWKKYEQMEFELYKKYQNIIHNDPPHKNTLSGFLRFLVKTPLKSQAHPDHKGNPEVPAYGSYHQQYWLDDKLIAVGVIDILPKGVSAVYFFYDPDYRELTLGTYGALKEVQLSRELYPSLGTTYYLMGFYVHSCKKMRYKGNMHPSDLLCPETYQWFPIEKCLEQLDKTKYCRFNEDQTACDSGECTEEDLDSLGIIAGDQYVTYKNFKKTLKSEADYVKIGKLIGKKAAKSLILIVD
ncbi:arginyl-tRNA--protein transferase 1 [Coccinella septempunctata]|uniref:arginyl-tRNA--protein transferase 1 n=1 Tax=Coccinella septempunctata TaxID=41139 RepID=UPI001D073092|nr:arginyl-tRNA--protein transferase 1 [Coccinella septempunctata]